MHGIIQGMSDTKLAPRGDATRAQVAAILMRFRLNVPDYHRPEFFGRMPFEE